MGAEVRESMQIHEREIILEQFDKICDAAIHVAIFHNFHQYLLGKD